MNCGFINKYLVSVPFKMSHRFCGDSILMVWKTSGIFAVISCPYCRQEVTGLVPYLREEEMNTKDSGEVELKSRILEEAGRSEMSEKWRDCRKQF